MASTETDQKLLHIFFFPLPAHGHMIPLLEISQLFASRGLKSTIVTTPHNLPLVSRSLHHHHPNININIVTVEFPSVEFGLPENCENADSIPSSSLIPNFMNATRKLQHPLENLLLRHKPDCLIADMFFPWATDSSAKFGIPRIVFHGHGSFSLCANECVRFYKPHMSVSSDSETFVIPNLPGEIKMTRVVVSDYLQRDDKEWLKKQEERRDSEKRSFGVIVNSFYELEKEYADYYKKVLLGRRKSWHIGPVSLLNREIKEKSNRGREADIDEQECLKWLDSKKPNSVIYVCFGTIANFQTSQLREIAMGLEASRKNFIWVVKRKKTEEKTEEEEEWIPEGFEKRIKGKGMIIRGWAPQMMILDHKSVGGFVTHCGWNSTLEGVSGGVAMVTWPVAAEQFYNEKFVTEVLRIGIPVGVKRLVRYVGDNSVGKEKIEKAVRRVMEGEEAEEMRNRAKEYSKMARAAVEEGGSSYLDISAFIQELSSRRRR